ncbi:hypothetical protein YC2023_025626 [Brassica napus]
MCILRTKIVKPMKPMKTIKTKRKDLKNKADDSLESKLKLPHHKFRALMAFIVGVGDVEEDGDGNDDEDVVEPRSQEETEHVTQKTENVFCNQNHHIFLVKLSTDKTKEMHTDTCKLNYKTRGKVPELDQQALGVLPQLLH